MREIFQSLAKLDKSKTYSLVTCVNESKLGETKLLEGDAQISDPNYFVRKIGGEPRLIVCGGGHVAIAVVKLARLLKLKVTVLEDREEFAENAQLAGADIIVGDNYEACIEQVEDSEDNYYIVVTRGHKCDISCLSEIAKKKAHYVGMIGSRKRVAVVKDTLRESGVSEQFIEQLYSPIGLNIGAETPEEIAVSILAEIIEIKNKSNQNNIPEDIICALSDSGDNPMCLVTIISRSGSAPRSKGATMLVKSDGSIMGTIGGGIGEHEIIELAITRMKDQGKTFIERIDMNNEDAAKDGMVCGGSIDVIMEIF